MQNCILKYFLPKRLSYQGRIQSVEGHGSVFQQESSECELH